MTSNNDEIVPAEPDSTDPKAAAHGWFRQSLNPFRIATLRGLGVLLPPLLTIIFFFWAWNTVERAVLQPVEAGARYLIVWTVNDTRDDAEVRVRLDLHARDDLNIIILAGRLSGDQRVLGCRQFLFQVFVLLQELSNLRSGLVRRTLQ